MAKKRPPSSSASKASSTAKPSASNSSQTNNQSPESLEALANKALTNVTETQLEEIMTTLVPDGFTLEDCWQKAQLFATALKKLEEDLNLLQVKGLKLEEKSQAIEEKESKFEADKNSFKNEKQQLEADRQALNRDRNSLDIQIQSLSNKERQIQERELNAEAGFITQNQSALRELEQATTNLRQERDRLYKEIDERRISLDAELAKRQDLFMSKLNDRQQQYEEELESQRAEIEAERQELLILRKEKRQEMRKLEAERELLQEDREAIELRIQLQSVAEVEKLKIEIQVLKERLKQSNTLRDSFEQKLLQRIEADRRFGQRTPDQVLAELSRLETKNEALEQQLATQPSYASLERLQQLESLQEIWESERLQLKTRTQEQERALSLSRIEVSSLETLRNEKEALEASSSRLREALKELRNDLALSVADNEKRSQFEHCAEMDQDSRLQNTTRLYGEILDLRIFANDLRDRIAFSQEKGKELYYSEQDIRAFLGGLAMSRLHILQGISGTGKTSLPLAFSRAVGDRQANNCKLIEVQAGWRDRQDLIGYFNAFEGRFYETDFLKAIYEAQTPLYRDQIYIVLLDEMNLSRPEQYFADFLSKLEQAESGQVPSLSLQSDPNKPFPKLFVNKGLPIPPNIWFIGTANQDETTLEFADKTYDRAHVMELHQQAKPFSLSRPEPRHPISYSALTKAFKRAKNEHAEEAQEVWKFLNESEFRNLLQRFKLGWGNRLKRQTDSFIPVVIAAGGSIGEATDHILATKILRKLRDRHDTPVDDLKHLKEHIETSWELLDTASLPEQSLKILQAEIHRLGGVNL